MRVVYAQFIDPKRDKRLAKELAKPPRLRQPLVYTVPARSNGSGRAYINWRHPLAVPAVLLIVAAVPLMFTWWIVAWLVAVVLWLSA